MEVYHSRLHSGMFMPEKIYKPIRKTIESAIPDELDEDHKSSLRDRLRYGNQYPFRKRLELIFDDVLAEFEETVGKSITETMGRSINTSLTVVLALLALIFLGAEATQNFAIVMLVGVLAGTFSSICRSAPLLIPLARWFRKA